MGDLEILAKISLISFYKWLKIKNCRPHFVCAPKILNFCWWLLMSKDSLGEIAKLPLNNMGYSGQANIAAETPKQTFRPLPGNLESRFWLYKNVLDPTRVQRADHWTQPSQQKWEISLEPTTCLF
jgi:hypothetical protein